MINVRRAEIDPANAVRANVTAGCGPVRVAASPDGHSVWVTARESNALLRFSTSQLLRHPADALTADLRVGQAPVALAVVNDGRQVVVGDSNRFSVPGSTAALTVVNTSSARPRTPAIAGYLPSGLFPARSRSNRMALCSSPTSIPSSSRSSKQANSPRSTRPRLASRFGFRRAARPSGRRPAGLSATATDSVAVDDRGLVRSPIAHQDSLGPCAGLSSQLGLPVPGHELLPSVGELELSDSQCREDVQPLGSS